MASDARDILVQNLVFIRFHKTLHFGFKYDKNFSQYYKLSTQLFHQPYVINTQRNIYLDRA